MVEESREDLFSYLIGHFQCSLEDLNRASSIADSCTIRCS